MMNELAQTAASEPLFNPLSPEFIRDPYPHYARLRTSDPMHLTPFGAYVASRHAEVSLRDARQTLRQGLHRANQAALRP